MTNKTKIIIGSTVGGVVLLGGVGALSQNNNNNSTSYPEDHIYTIDEICSRADTEQNFGNKHSDEVFTISGIVDHTSYKSVYFESNIDKSSYSKYKLECEFDDQEEIETLSEDDTVTISGKLYHLILSEITLKDCTLVSVDKSKDTSEDTSNTSTRGEEDTSSNTTNQSTESSSQNSSGSFETSSDISEPESSAVESSSTRSSEATPEPPQSSATSENHFSDYSNPEQQNTTEYVLNTGTFKIHFASCNYVKEIAEENYATTTDFDWAISNGYTSCGHCHAH